MNPSTLRVLVVDDDEEDFLILRDLLSDYPQGRFDLEWAPTLADGVRALREDRHDVFLVDYQLGPDNGMDLVRLAVAEGSPHRPVVMLTGHGNSEVDREALSAGAADYLVKGSIDSEKLARSLRYAAERSRQMAEIKESKQRYRRLFELNPFPTWVYDKATLQFVAVNDAMVASYGYSREELLGMDLTHIRDAADNARLFEVMATWGDKSGNAGVWRHRRKDGSTLWMDITTHNIQLDGRDCRMVIAHDITGQRESQGRLLMLERAVESSVNGIVICDTLSADMPIVYVNPAFEQITGYSSSEAVGRNCRFLRGSDDDQPELMVLRDALALGEDCNVILRNYRKDGSCFWNHLFLSPVRDVQGELTHYVGIQNDLTERRQVEAELTFAANHDPVTRLPRFPILEAALATMLDDEASRTSVLFIDLDRFHNINESMGHLIGDEALGIVAERMSAVLGGPGFLARFAGDEFVAMCRDLDPPQVLALADRLRAAIGLPIEGDGYRLFLTASIGISHAPEHGQSAMELLRRAEAAMTRAKRQGRDAVCEFSVGQMQELEDRLVLGGRIRDAIRLGELQLHYQPQLHTQSRVVTGLEALVRWHSPELGPVPPGRFIPIAESLGLMPELGLWVLDEACRQLRAWMDAGFGRFTVAVNFSALQLQRPDIVCQVSQSLARHGVPADRLEIELTESSLMENVERVQGRLAELKSLGVSLSLDDFGTGYSSLSYLKQFSLDKLKIDRSFVRDLPDDPNDAAIARTIIAMGHQLHMVVAAEGVETQAQAAFLSDIGCDELQGYLFARPAAAADIEPLLPRS